MPKNSDRPSGSAVAALGPSCSGACGPVPDQGSNLCPRHCKAQTLNRWATEAPFSSSSAHDLGVASLPSVLSRELPQLCSSPFRSSLTLSSRSPISLDRSMTSITLLFRVLLQSFATENHRILGPPHLSSGPHSWCNVSVLTFGMGNSFGHSLIRGNC